MNEAAILDGETNHQKSEDFYLENSVLLVGVRFTTKKRCDPTEHCTVFVLLL